MRKKKKIRLNKVDILFWAGAVLFSLALGLWWGIPQGFAVFGLCCFAASFLEEPPVKEDD